MVHCERCGPHVRATIAYRRGTSVWAFCPHHARQHDKVLKRMGYTRQTLEAMIHSG